MIKRQLTGFRKIILNNRTNMIGALLRLARMSLQNLLLGRKSI